jgi:L-glyceraldehyde reductase
LETESRSLVINVPIASTWQAMEALVAAGKARSIGVSIFNQAQLEELITT